jgi:hypothetical protein
VERLLSSFTSTIQLFLATSDLLGVQCTSVSIVSFTIDLYLVFHEYPRRVVWMAQPHRCHCSGDKDRVCLETDVISGESLTEKH